MNSEWGFQALIWPVWQLGRLGGVYAWNWVTGLIAFGLVWYTSRALGVRGHLPFLVVAIAVLSYRQRSFGRPETIAAVLLAAQICLLELRRQQGRRTLWALPLLACIWANTHITYIFGIAVLVIYVLGNFMQRPSRDHSSLKLMTGELSRVLVVSVLVLFLNPFGWEALMEPFRYAFVLRREAMYQTIWELMPLDWGYNLRNGLPVLVVLWLLLQIWRASRKRLDLTELLLWLTFSVLMVLSRRLVSMWVIVAAPFLARDLREWLSCRNWKPMFAPTWVRATGIAVASMVVSVPEWSRPHVVPGMGVDPLTYPAAACDFIEERGIHGHVFNHFEFGSYMLWRFGHDRDRLPFMDIRQAGTPELRQLYLDALGDRSGASWRQLDRGYACEYVLLRRLRAQGDYLADVLDADATWSLVFTDDVAALYVRRNGSYQAIADSLAYSLIGASTARLQESWMASLADTSIRQRFEKEAARMARSSPMNSTAHSLLSYIAMADGRLEETRRELLLAHEVDPGLPRYHERLGLAFLGEGNLQAALREFLAAERRHESDAINHLLGVTYSQLGDLRRARQYFASSIRKDAGNTASADSIRAIDSRLQRSR